MSGELRFVVVKRGGAYLERLVSEHHTDGAAATVLTTELEDPGSYGRVVRNSSGEVERVVEAKGAGDADPEQLAIREINAGAYVIEREVIEELGQRPTVGHISLAATEARPA